VQSDSTPALLDDDVVVRTWDTNAWTLGSAAKSVVGRSDGLLLLYSDRQSRNMAQAPGVRMSHNIFRNPQQEYFFG
jgi:hypothetical protein